MPPLQWSKETVDCCAASDTVEPLNQFSPETQDPPAPLARRSSRPLRGTGSRPRINVQLARCLGRSSTRALAESTSDRTLPRGLTQTFNHTLAHGTPMSPESPFEPHSRNEDRRHPKQVSSRRTFEPLRPRERQPTRRRHVSGHAERSDSNPQVHSNVQAQPSIQGHECVVIGTASLDSLHPARFTCALTSASS